MLAKLTMPFECLPNNQLFEHAASRLKHVGFDYLFYGMQMPQLNSNEPFELIWENYPNDWFNIYEDMDFRACDPCLKHTFTSVTHAVWTKEFFDDNFKSQMLCSEARLAGVRSGCTIPIHGPSGDVATISVASSLFMDAALWTAPLLSSLHFFSLYLHDAILRNVKQQQNSPVHQIKTLSLTARELEVLSWTAVGKTAWEIGQILSIAECTVTYHINNIVSKLGATNKVQAVAKAMKLRLLNI